jgi:hypothetical protein
LLSLADEQVHFPRPSDGKKMVSFDWTPIRYRNVISVLKNPFYAGVYVYGKTEKRTAIVDGRVRKTYKHGKPIDRWEVMLKDHHDAYIDWAEFERNQKQLALNAYGKVDGVKSGRGGRALVSGNAVLRTVRTAPGHWRMSGRGGNPVYRCDRPNMQYAKSRCFTFGGRRPDEAVARELLRASSPWRSKLHCKRNRGTWKFRLTNVASSELELQQARYEASLAERRYAACDPDNRLIAAQLEKSWETALQRVRLRAALGRDRDMRSPGEARPWPVLPRSRCRAWDAPGVTMRARQQLLRALVKDIIADIDDETRDRVDDSLAAVDSIRK